MLRHEAENDITRVVSNHLTVSTPQSCNQTLISLKPEKKMITLIRLFNS